MYIQPVSDISEIELFLILYFEYFLIPLNFIVKYVEH